MAFKLIPISMPESVAREVCEMAEICCSNGLGPGTNVLMEWIADNYPGLKKDFAWLPWGLYGKE